MSTIPKTLPLSIEPGARPERSEPAAPEGGGGFGAALSAYLGSVQRTQKEADAEVTRLALGEGNLHEVAIALEKAELSTRLMVQVRNKIVDAYREVMRMNV
jgi:flagellar hook-basal body complex protein FliE